MYKSVGEYKLLILIVLIGSFLRIFQIMFVPIHLNHDEISQLYDAISIAQTQKDAYGNYLPVIFYSLHDFKPPLYTYLTSIASLLFGDKEFIIKIPGIFFGILVIPATYFFVRTYLKDKVLGLMSAFLIAISPAEIFYSRKSFESVIGLCLMLFGFGLIQIYLHKKQRKWLLTGLIVLCVAMYTYFSYVLIVPALVVAFILINRKVLLKDIQPLIVPVIFTIVLTLPLVFLTFTNNDSRYRAQSVFVTQDPNLGRYIDNENDIFLRSKILLEFSFNRYLDQFRLDRLFLNGLDLTNQPLSSGPLLVFSLPLLLIGLARLFGSNEFLKQRSFIASWVLFGTIPSSLTFELFSPHRMLIVFTMLTIISAIGANYLYKSYGRILVLLLAILSLGYFLHIYGVNYGYEKSQYLHYPFEDVSRYLWSEHDNFSQIIFDPKFGEDAPVIGTGAHYYLAYYGNYPPIKFQQEYHLGDQNKRESLFDKFSIRAVNWADDRTLKNTLLVVSPWSVVPEEVNQDMIVKKFYFYDGRLAFYAIKL